MYQVCGPVDFETGPDTVRRVFPVTVTHINYIRCLSREQGIGGFLKSGLGGALFASTVIHWSIYLLGGPLAFQGYHLIGVILCLFGWVLERSTRRSLDAFLRNIMEPPAGYPVPRIRLDGSLEPYE